MLVGLIAFLKPLPIIMVLVGTIVGMLVGSLPGLTATMGVALLIPFTFGLNPLAGLSLLAGIYCGAVYGGSISQFSLASQEPRSSGNILDGYRTNQTGRL